LLLETCSQLEAIRAPFQVSQEKLSGWTEMGAVGIDDKTIRRMKVVHEGEF
jgi:hypothetical protein